MGLFLGCFVGCSSSSSDSTPAPPVVDNVDGPAAVSLQPGGWPVQVTVTFHDDTENVAQVVFEATNALSKQSPVDMPAKQGSQVIKYTLESGPNEFQPGDLHYSVAVISESGQVSEAVGKTVTLK